MRRRPRYILPREKTIREGACSNARALTRRCDVLRNAVVFGKPTESRVVSHFDSGRASPVAKGTGKESARDRMRRYRDRAEECRMHAAEMKDPEIPLRASRTDDGEDLRHGRERTTRSPNLVEVAVPTKAVLEAARTRQRFASVVPTT